MKTKQILKRLCIGAVIVVAALVTIFSLWAAVENYSGAKRWVATQEKLKSANVELDFKKLIPEMPREKDNFARTPLIASVTDFEQKDGPESEIIYKNPELRKRFLAIKLPRIDEANPLRSWQSGRETNLGAFQKALTKAKGEEISIADWLTQFEAEFAEIDAATALPEAQLSVDVGETFMDHVNTVMPFLSDFREYQRVQAVRATVALENGDVEEARLALGTSFQLYRTSSSHPTLIGYLVGQTSLEHGLSIIWHGMKINAWAEEDLEWIQSQLADLQVIDKLEQALIFEMVTFQIGAGNFLKTVGQEDSRELVKLVGQIESYGSMGLGLLTPLIPSGVWDHNMSFGCEVMFEHYITPLRERRLPDWAAVEDRLKDGNLRNFLARLTLPAISSVAEKGFHISVAVDLARVACAVERFQLATGRYPDSLDEITPEFIKKIPADLMTDGEPLRYSNDTQGDRYRIYSVGKNGTDEGGVVVFENQRRRRNLDEGDWAWGYDLDLPEKR